MKRSQVCKVNKSGTQRDPSSEHIFTRMVRYMSANKSKEMKFKRHKILSQWVPGTVSLYRVG
jgi:hypothetical protein